MMFEREHFAAASRAPSVSQADEVPLHLQFAGRRVEHVPAKLSLAVLLVLQRHAESDDLPVQIDRVGNEELALAAVNTPHPLAIRLIEAHDLWAFAVEKPRQDVVA